MTPPDRFRYDGFTVDEVTGTVACSYGIPGYAFTERFGFGPDRNWADPAVRAALRLLFLVAGVSYYKTTAAPVIDLGELATTTAEREFLRAYYSGGLAEFAHRNGIDLSGTAIAGPDAPASTPAPYEPEPGRPLIPFGGGIDSIVTVDALTHEHPDAALFVAHPPGDRFDALEDAAAVTGLPVTRVTREIDPQVRRSAELGFRNGHVPITAVITAAAVVAAVLDGRDAVVLSNEWSASVPTVVTDDGRPVNHQWSKSEEFERAFAGMVTASLGPRLSVFSYLRPRTELWVARQFAGLDAFWGAFRSCNRAFAQDPAQRLDRWCATCDKCCFIDLILSPFMAATDLAAVFAGREPLDDPSNEGRFRTLLGLGAEAKPFECVGDVDECRAALRLAAARTDRTDRTGSALLQRLLADIGGGAADPAALLAPRGTHLIPDRYAPADLLVRAR
jgi:hypothetical protein